MRLTNLGQRQQLLGSPLTRCDRLAVDPLGRIGVALNLHVVAQLLLPDHAALAEQELDLALDKRVALDRGRVVGLLVPDGGPDIFGFGRQRQTAQPRAQLADLELEALMKRFAGRAASPLGRLLRHAETNSSEASWVRLLRGRSNNSSKAT